MNDLEQEICGLEEREKQLLQQRARFEPGTLSYNETNGELERLQKKLSLLRDELAQQGRIQKQTDDLGAIVLPNDYNEVFADPRANQEIINLIRQVKEQLYSDHNAELLDLHQAYTLKIAAAEDKAVLALISVEQLSEQLRLVREDKDDAYQKLANAVVLKDEAELQSTQAVTLMDEAQVVASKLVHENEALKEQIDELEGLLRTYKKPMNTTGLHLTSTLKPETDEERKARASREQIETINRNLTKRGVDPLPMPVVKVIEQPVTKEQLEDSFRSVAANETVAQDNIAGVGVQPAAEKVDSARDEEAAITLEARVADLEAWRAEMQKLTTGAD